MQESAFLKSAVWCLGACLFAACGRTVSDDPSASKGREASARVSSALTRAPTGHECCEYILDDCTMGGTAGLPAECAQGHVTVDVDCGFFCCLGDIFTNPCPGFVLSGACTRAFEPEATADSDGDGLSDSAEICGLDTNNDGTYDFSLSALGANPNHKDIFVELDWMAGQNPNRDAIQRLKQAFAAAPINAGGVVNPDGQPGINLWVDTGSLTDPTASEDGAGPNSCSDGIDNGGDGLADGNDPDCLVGDNLGGGNQIPTQNICDVNIDDFVNVKNANFNHARAYAFHYAISALGCDLNADGVKDSGGFGEIGGNDFIEYNHDSGTIMHELGHNLNLRHGGNVDANCKPNYVSVMNYDQQFGIPQNGGGAIIDYSPPRFAGGRGVAPLNPLFEDNLDDGVVLDGTDPSNRFIFTDPNGHKVQAPLNVGVNWNSDVDPPLETNQSINIDTSDSNGHPSKCTNTTITGAPGLTGYDDWTNIRMNFHDSPDSADGVFNPPLSDPDPPLSELLALQTEINTTDLEITGSATPAPVPAGTVLTYSFLVQNNGPNPATGSLLRFQIPAGTTLSSSPPSCGPGNPGELLCPLGELLASTGRALSFTVQVPANFVYNGGTAVVSTSEVTHSAGPDSVPGNNTLTLTTPVAQVSDLALTGLDPEVAPMDALIGASTPVTFHAAAANLGPSSPADAVVQSTLSAPPGAHVVVPPADVPLTALSIGSPTQVTLEAQIACDQPGPHIFTLTSTIALARPGETDPVSGNNTATTQVTVECVVPVSIDIKPGSDRNPINLNSLVPLAVLTTAAGEYGNPLAFDATRIDPLSVRFGPEGVVWSGTGGAAEVHQRGHLEDVAELGRTQGDGDLDMVLHFSAAESGLSSSDTRACVKGEFFDAGGIRRKFFGCDGIVIVP